METQLVKFRQGKESKPIPVLLDRALRERIEAISARMGEPKSTVMRIAMRLGLDTIAAALEIKPAILKQLIVENRQAESPPSYPSPQPQHVTMNDPLSSVSKADSPRTGQLDTEQLDKGALEAVKRDREKRRKSGPA